MAFHGPGYERIWRVDRHYVACAAIIGLFLAIVVALEPLGAHWYAGDGYEAGYPASAASLMRGDEPSYLDHPGVPVQQAIALMMTAAWAVAPKGESRDERAQRLIGDIDRTRPYSRGTGVALTFASALVVLFVLGRYFGAWWGLLGALLFLTAPGLLSVAIYPTPDFLLGALALAATSLLVDGASRRDGASYLGAAVLTGFAVSVKIHALALVPVLAIVLAARPPADGWRRAVARSARERRRPVLVVAVAWLALVALLNAGAQLPSLRGLGRFAVDAVAVAAVLGVLLAVLWRTRFRPAAEVALACVVAAGAGWALPNTLFLNAVPEATRVVTDALHGGGVNQIVEPLAGALYPARPWLPLCGLGLAGLALALRSGRYEHAVWAAAAAAFAGVALSRRTVLHYWAPTVMLLIPLALFALQRNRIHAGLVATATVVLLVAAPIRSEIAHARDRGRAADEVRDVRDRVHAALGPRDVALTTMSEFYAYADLWKATTPDTNQRVLPAIVPAAEYARRNGLRVRLLVDPTGKSEKIAAELALRLVGPHPSLAHTYLVAGR